MSSTSMNSAERQFAPAFFKAINDHDEAAAMNALKIAAFKDDGAPSPRAAKLIEQGEWDVKTRLTLAYVDDSCCKGRVGTEGSRFCGRRSGTCNTASHERNVVSDVKAGWYISNSGKGGGVFSDHHLPLEADGGPIQASGAAFLTDGDQAFKMTKGQWVFAFDAWHAGRVLTSWDSEEEVIFSPKAETNEAEKPSPREMLDAFRKQAEGMADDDEDDDEEEDEDGTGNGYLMSLDEMRHFGGAMRSELESMMSSFRSQMSSTTKKLSEEHRESDRRINLLEHQNTVLTDLLRDSTTKWTNLQREQDLANQVHRDYVTQTNQSLRVLKGQIEALPVGGTGGGGLTQAQSELLRTLDHAVLGTDGAFSILRTQFSTFRDKMESGGGVECAGVSFNSKRELIAWFDDKNLNIEIFLDALAFLHAIKAAVVHIEDAGRQREYEVKAKATSTLQMAVVTSFDTIIPSVFVGAKKTAESGGSAYDWLKGNMKSFDAWKPVGMTNGVANQVLEGIPKVTNRINELRRYQTSDTNAILLSSGLCQDSAHFCLELVRFINEQHEELTQKTIYSSSQVWSMQLECLQKIIEELSEARESVADAARFQPGYYLWGMLKAWRVQQRYLENHFKDDPALTGIMVRRILLQGQDTSVKSKLEKIDALERDLKEYQRKEEEHWRGNLGEINKLKQQRQNPGGKGKDKDKDKE